MSSEFYSFLTLRVHYCNLGGILSRSLCLKCLHQSPNRMQCSYFARDSSQDPLRTKDAFGLEYASSLMLKRLLRADLRSL